MENKLIIKGLVFGIIVLFVAINLNPLTESFIKKEMISTDYSEKEYIGYAEDKTPISMNSYVNSNTDDKIVKSSWFIVPSVVKRGDIMFCNHRPCLPNYHDVLFAHGHVSIYAGNNRFVEATTIYPWIYKGSQGLDLCKIGVLKTSFSFLNLWANNIIFSTVRNASESQRDNAVKWAETQIGHPYQFASVPRWPYHYCTWWTCSNPNGSTYNPDTGKYFIEKYPDYYFCTELVWAAYKHCNGDSGMDLGAKWEYDENDDSWHWCISPDYLLNNYEQIYLYTDGDYGNPGYGKPVIESYKVNVSSDSATIYGKILDDGGERCHCYIYLIGEGNRYCGFFDRTSADTFTGAYNFSRIIKNLEPETTYQWYAWAYNSFGEAYGEIKSFTTLSSK